MEALTPEGSACLMHDWTRKLTFGNEPWEDFVFLGFIAVAVLGPPIAIALALIA